MAIFDSLDHDCHNLPMERRQLTRLVRQALAHLYDQAYLQRHPLAAALAPGTGLEQSGQAVHRTLLEAIASLRPPLHVPHNAASWRAYQILFLYYIDGKERNLVAEELGISPRQFSREQSKALDAVAEILWERYWQVAEQPSQAVPRQALLEAELRRLGTSSAAGTTLLEPTLQSVIAILTESAAASGIRFQIMLPPKLPGVLVERVVLRQVLLNVLAGVIEEGSPGIVELSALHAASYVTLAVRRIDRSDTYPITFANSRRLSLAARLLSMQGGCLQVDDSPGRHLSLYLPLQKAATVLVIDDNPDLIQLFRRYLAGSIYQVLAADNGPEAVRLAQEVRPCAITLDVMMPSQDGWEILQTLKNLPATRDIPVIVCSVLHERTLALNLGADEFLVKPVNQQALLAALEGCLRSPLVAALSGSP